MAKTKQRSAAAKRPGGRKAPAKSSSKPSSHAPKSSSREKSVKDVVVKAAAGKAAKAGKVAAASAPAKGAAKSAPPVAKSAAAKVNGKAPATKAAAAAKATPAKVDGKAAKIVKGAKGKPPPAPPPPPRKIQVVQLTTLKPGARGSKASVARRPPNEEDRAALQAAAMKKRRSAELTKTQLDHFRELLQQRRTRLNSDLSLMQDEALKVTAQDNSSDSVADTGTDNYEQDFTLGLIESEEALAREVDQALVRIEQNSFGVCESCQTPIPLARLEILPFARHCVECQQKREGRG
jgi:RNA polymerase-binding protein DksA